MISRLARHRPRGLYVPAPEAPVWLWNGWRPHEDSVAGLIPSDVVLLLPPPCFRARDESEAA
jgi:hypothetical protein